MTNLQSYLEKMKINALQRMRATVLTKNSLICEPLNRTETEQNRNSKNVADLKRALKIIWKALYKKSTVRFLEAV